MSTNSKYSMRDGAIFREDVKVATRDPQTGTVEYLPDMERYRAQVAGFLKEQGMDKPPVTPPEVLARQAVPRVAGAGREEPPPTVTEERTPRVFNATVISDGQDPVETVEQKRARLQAELAALDGPQAKDPRIVQLEAENARLRAKMQPVAAPVAKLTAVMAGDDPLLQQYVTEGAPAFHPEEGDKTRDFVNWLYEKHPDHAEKRFFGRRTHRGL